MSQTKPFNYCSPSEEYQGWTNAQTWCVALTINNTRQNQEYFKKRAAAISGPLKPRPSDAVIKAYLMDLAKFNTMSKQIYDMSPWAWNQGQTLEDVNWSEIYDDLIRE